MSFVTVGSAGEAPTFFELIAAEKLMPSLKAAVTYAISVYAQRRPHLLRLLDSEDELFFLISIFLERHALLHSNASFAEGLYSMRRVAATTASSSGSSSSSSKPVALTPTQRRTSLMLITLLPYVKGKLDAMYIATQQQRYGPRGFPATTNMPQSGTPSTTTAPTASSPTNEGESALQNPQQQLRQKLLDVFLSLYPWINAAHEGSRFFYQLFYLVGKSRYFSPELHFLGLVVARTSPHDVAAAAQQRAAYREERVRHARRPGIGGLPLRLLREGWVRVTGAAADHTRGALILSVFAFKLLEWWYTSAEQKLGGHKALPPPPPPPALPLAPSGVPIPKDLTKCPLCSKTRTNPAMIATSGHVFCYPCAYRYVEERGCCPVTLAPARRDHIRRLYQGA